MKFIRFILLLIHLGVVSLLGATLLNAYIPPKIFSFLNFLSLGFPALFIIHVFLTLIWIFTWKKRAIFFLLISVLFFNPVRRWINVSPKSEVTPNLKILTMNVKGGKLGEEKIKNYIQKTDADIVFLQENSTMQFPNTVTYPVNYPLTTIITKHKILNHNNFKKYDYSFYADIEINGKPVRCINIYLEPFFLEKSMVKPRQDAETNTLKFRKLVSKMRPTFKIHQEQIEKIRKAIKDSPYPVIVAGDFNSVPNSWEYFNLNDGLKDTFVEVGNGSATSFHDYKVPIRIDYILTSPSIKPISYNVDRSVKLSDHFPVIGTFKF